jgi:phospholipid/cholesterol/gamma-HCH transport system substrate-binding protein
MEREANYAAVGAFVLLVTAMAGLFVYWYADSRDAREYQRYEIYFEGSVSGLTEGSTVRFLGVDVGRVRDIRVDRRAAGRVQVIADIDSEAPVTATTVAELSLQGVTGLLYIDLLGQPGTKKLIDDVPSERFPVIASVRSNFDVFVSSLPDVVASAGQVAQRVNMVLSDANIEALSRTVANIEAASRTLPGTMREIDLLAKDLRSAAVEVRAVAASVRTLTDAAAPEATAALQRVRVAADNLATTTTRLDQLLAESQRDVRSFARDGLPALEQLVRDSRDAASEFQALMRSLRENPSQLVYEPPASGVEIPR